MSNHTPGPWVLHKRDDEDEATMVKHVGENDDVYVCVTNVNWRYPKVNAANARLISATPEILEALKELSEYVEYLYEKRMIERPRQLREAFDAIAKAEGRS